MPGHEAFAVESTATSRRAHPLDGVPVSNASDQATNNPAQPGWFEALGRRLGPNELHRRTWHFTPGVLALIAAAMPNWGPMPPWVLLLMFVVCVTGAIVALHFQKSIQRATENNCLAPILGYLVCGVPLLLFFPRFPGLGLAVTGIIAFGDGSAALFGLLWGSTKLPWNKTKTWVGTASFVFVAFPITTLLYWGGSLTHVSINDAVLCIGPTVVVAALVESLLIRLNDNMFVGLSAAITLLGLHTLIVGWA